MLCLNLAGFTLCKTSFFLLDDIDSDKTEYIGKLFVVLLGTVEPPFSRCLLESRTLSQQARPTPLHGFISPTVYNCTETNVF